MLHRSLPTSASHSRLAMAPDPMCPQCGDPLGHVMFARRMMSGIEYSLKCGGCGTIWESVVAGSFRGEPSRSSSGRH